MFIPDKFKKITGRDSIYARELGTKNTAYFSAGTSLIQLNTMPTFPKIDIALIERIVVVDFPYSFVDENDPKLIEQPLIYKIKDPSLKASYDNYENGAVNEAMSNPFNVMSILMDYQGVIPGTTDAYKVSTNAADKGKPNVIYYSDPDGDGSYTPDFTPAQRKAAEDYTRQQFKGMIDHEESNAAIGEISQSTAASIGLKDQKQRSDTFGELIGALISGTPNEKMKASAALNNMKNADGTPVGNKVEVSPDGNVTFIDAASGRVNPFNITGGDKAASGMQMYTMFAAPFELDKEAFKRKLMATGSKDVVIPKTTVRTQSGTLKNTTTTNTGQYDTSKYN
jgi:hypothetical protein